MGAHLVGLLSERGDAVFVTSRRARPSYDNITYVQGNAHDDGFLRSLLSGRRWDAIVDFMIYTTGEFRLRAPLLLAATAQYLFLSSARVYAGSVAPITEDSPRLLDVSRDREYLATDEYALAKARQENLLSDSGRANWTIIRPYITYSEMRLQLGVLEKEAWLARALRGQTVVFSEDIAGRMTTLTYGHDVARGIAALIGEEKALGEAFHITCDRPIRWREALDIYLDALESETGRRPKALLTDAAPVITPQVKYDRHYDRVFDNTKIRGFIDTRSFVEPREGLRRCLEAFLGQPQFGQIPARTVARLDRMAMERTPLAAFDGAKRKAVYLLFRDWPAAAQGLIRASRKIKHRKP